MQVPVDPKKVVELPKPMVERLAKQRENAFERFPLLFTLLATFGVTATLYGFEHMIDKIHWLANNPVVALAAGLGILLLTGSLYKKL